MRRFGALNECWGHKLQYTNPVTGDWAMPTMGQFMQLMPKGFKGRPYRSTDSTIYVAVEGSGRCVVNGQVLEFGPKDVLVCPAMMPFCSAIPIVLRSKRLICGVSKSAKYRL